MYILQLLLVHVVFAMRKRAEFFTGRKFQANEWEENRKSELLTARYEWKTETG